MRDLFGWSIPLGRVFGISVKVHWLFPVVALGLILRTGYNDDYLRGSWVDMLMLVGLLFVSVLLHEFGHCFGARMVDGDADEVLIWPLGGLAAIEVPHTPRANFLATFAGPLVNILLCLISGLLLLALSDPPLRPPWNPLWYPLRTNEQGWITLNQLNGMPVEVAGIGPIILARLFYLNWIGLLLNLLPGFPLDGGRMFQCMLWPRLGFAQATRVAVYVGFGVALVVGIFSIAANELLAFCLACFIWATCRQQLIFLETGGEESLFGYDFSQGYTSLERDAPPRRRRQSFLQRWLQKRRQLRMQRDQEQREAEERRMDELLEKVQREGLQALTDEERRFLTRVSHRYRNRQ
jgi:Zn-dependent protease